jgi:dihydroorotate dehydrogenase (NAD+) catalytic subunit
MDGECSASVVKQIVQAFGTIPLIVKVGPFADKNLQRKMMIGIAKAGARAICGLNSLPMTVNKPDGTPALSGRQKSGVCGGPIRHDALRFVRNARRIIDEECLDMTLLGCGGITKPEHFDECLAAGAEFAVTATGMMWDPYLAMRWHNRNCNGVIL